jgi:hypothetical protein
MPFIYGCSNPSCSTPEAQTAFISASDVCPHCGAIGIPIVDRETLCPVVATSEDGLRIAYCLGYNDAELQAMEREARGYFAEENDPNRFSQ